MLDRREVFIISVLPEGSWFGDFNLHHDLTSQFSYQARVNEDEAD